MPRFVVRRWMNAWIFAALAVGAASVQAAPPWASLLPFKKVESDPHKQYALTEESGPWMIMAMSFPGDDEGRRQAQRLALELRREFKLEAWTHEQEVELEETVEGLGVDSRGNPKRMKYMHGSGGSEVAVLVGSFKSFEDPDAARVLKKLRTAQVKSLSGGAQSDSRSEFRIRDLYRFASTKDPERRGPLARAFVTRNPMLPVEEVARQTMDPFVEDLNDGIEYSLLKNPDRYTVVVGTFRGAAAYSEKNFEDTIRKSIQKRGDTQIDQAAKDATKVVNTLRKEGLEAYVFHDRYESLVTVGSFNDVGREMPDGHTELNADIAAVIKRFEAQRAALGDPNGQVGLVPKVVAGVPLDLTPQLILVPRKSIADVYR